MPAGNRIHDGAARAVRRLAGCQGTLAVAESLTAGLVMSSLAAVPGVSQWLSGGVVAYSHDVKVDVLGVSRELLVCQGAVCPEVAGQMARGVHRLTGARYTLATTGVAGPGPNEGKEQGHVVCCAVDNHTGATLVREEVFPGDRAAVRAAAVAAVLDLLERILDTGEQS